MTRDTWFSNVGAEADGNNGGADKLKLKSNQEMSLIDVDPAALKGRVIQGATLHLHLAGEPILHRVTVGSFGAEWVEGTSASYAPQKGSSSHNHRQYPDVPWTVPGSDLCSVMLGQGGTLWRMADALPPDAGGWQKVAVDPAVVAARVAGISYGFLLFDDTGSEWTRDGDKFTPIHMPNRFVHSREAGPERRPVPDGLPRRRGQGAAGRAHEPARRGAPTCRPARRGCRGSRPRTRDRPGPSASSCASTARRCRAISFRRPAGRASQCGCTCAT